MSEDEKARRKQYLKEYNQKPEVRARRKERDSTPEAIERRKIKDKIHYDKHREKKLAQKKEYHERTYVRTNRDWRKIIEIVKQELEKFESQGIKPTLRTMHYRLFSLIGEIYHNTKGDYGLLSKKTTIAREYKIRGVKVEDRYFPTLDINCFADDTRIATRYISELDKWQPEKQISELISRLKELPNEFQIPRWLGQPHYVEIWIEKKALRSTFEQLVKGKEVDIVPFGGFHSVPYLNENINILKAYQGLVKFKSQDNFITETKQIHILYFGDFDPTGEAIERVLRKRLVDYGAHHIDFQRIGVTYDQMIEFKLPQKLDPKTYKKIKENDSNAGRFLDKYKEIFQVEVDALPARRPDEFRKMVIDNIDKYFDDEIYQQELAKYTPEKIRELENKTVRSEFTID